MGAPKKILILAANPAGTMRLRLDEEVREIKEGLLRSKRRDEFIIEQREAVRIRDLRRALLDVEPQIVHFSGHGHTQGIVLEDESGQAIVVEPEALAGLFELFVQRVECVFLNACYSEAQATAINRWVKYVVGMVKEISDRAAIEFAVGFYDALGAGKAYEEAFPFGCNAIRLKSLPEGLTPILKVNPNLRPPRPTIRIFICYKSAAEPDRTLAQEVVQALRRNEYYVFIDKDIPVGLEWWPHIDAELKTADVFIALLSEQAVKSEMVKGEIRKAFNLNKESGRPLILPVRVQNRTEFQYPINMYLNHINWTQWDQPADTPRLINELDCAIAGVPLPARERYNLTISSADQTSEIYIPTSSAPLHGSKQSPYEEDQEAQFYIERGSDQIALRAIEKLGVTILIKGPRHMGKTLLLNRVIQAARKLNKMTACLDLELIDQTVLADPTAFYVQFCAWISNELGIENRVAEYWDMNLSNNLRCTLYMDRYLLPLIDMPLVLAIDELGTIFYTDFRVDFLSLLRNWHNQRKIDSSWKNLDLVLVTATEPYFFIDDIQQSPFNIGEVIELKDFTAEQVAELNRRHGLPFDPKQAMELMKLLNGHPFLVRQAMYLVANKIITPEELFARAIDDDGPFADHLRYRFYKIYDKAELVQAVKKIIKGHKCNDDRMSYKLQALGLLKLENRKIVFRCELYRRYFENLLYG